MSAHDEITPASRSHAYAHIPEEEQHFNESSSNSTPPAASHPAKEADPDARFTRVFLYCLYGLAIVAVIAAIIVLSFLFTRA